MRIKIVKCEARNTVSIGNIDKFRALRDSASVPEEVPLGRNEVVDLLRGLNADHGLIQRLPK